MLSPIAFVIRSKFKIILCLILTFSACTCIAWLVTSLSKTAYVRNLISGDIIDFSGANNVTGYPYYIVPNVVHLVHFSLDSKPKLEFIEAITIKAAHLNQKPDKIVIHCNCRELSGKYWNMVKNITGLVVHYVETPTHIFGKPLSSIYHASDIARIRLMMKYGGIYIDSDTYITKSLNKYRNFECTLGWPLKQNMGTQIILAHRNARFLKLWYNSYKYYRPEKWYYNAGELPTQTILQVKPSLVHRVERDFGVHDLTRMLFAVRTNEWKTYDAIHLLIRHRKYLAPSDAVDTLDEESIKAYDRSFGEMARLVLYGTTEIIENDSNSINETILMNANFF